MEWKLQKILVYLARSSSFPEIPENAVSSVCQWKFPEFITGIFHQMESVEDRVCILQYET